MSKQAIHHYYNRLDQYKRFGGTHNESSIRLNIGIMTSILAEIYNNGFTVEYNRL